MRHPLVRSIIAATALALWIVLTFVLDLRSGWTHLPLVAGVLFTVGTIVAVDETRGDRGT